MVESAPLDVSLKSGPERRSRLLFRNFHCVKARLALSIVIICAMQCRMADAYACSLLRAVPCRAQDLDNVTISGRVTDQTGPGVPGAAITAVFLRTGAERYAIP